MKVEPVPARPAATAGHTTASLSGAETGLLDWAVGIGGLWLIAGLYLDGWAHHRIPLETFFTPWHAVLYSGYAVTAAAVGLAFLAGLRSRSGLRSSGMRLGAVWAAVRGALPAGYLPSLVGAGLFLLGGLADMAWHTLFGIENDLEALLSPPHLLLVLGGSLLVTGPLRAASLRARRSGAAPAAPGLPALFSLIAVVGLAAFFTAYVNPYMEGAAPALRGLGFQLESGSPVPIAAGVLVQSALMTGACLLLIRRFRLPFGALALLFSAVTLLAVSQHENWGMFPLGLLAGLAADGLNRALRPGEGRGWAVRLFSFSVPLVYFGLFFAALLLSGSMFWSRELWGGMVLLGGFAGLLVSYGFFEGDS